uniref:(northern house mosquito) hypothetical protein n=1 Tax=Culex pipiens TaxID=7175 RepID=A0A8D8KDZ3_CULPI
MKTEKPRRKSPRLGRLLSRWMSRNRDRRRRPMAPGASRPKEPRRTMMRRAVATWRSPGRSSNWPSKSSKHRPTKGSTICRSATRNWLESPSRTLTSAKPSTITRNPSRFTRKRASPTAAWLRRSSTRLVCAT